MMDSNSTPIVLRDTEPHFAADRSLQEMAESGPFRASGFLLGHVSGHFVRISQSNMGTERRTAVAAGDSSRHFSRQSVARGQSPTSGIPTVSRQKCRDIRSEGCSKRGSRHESRHCVAIQEWRSLRTADRDIGNCVNAASSINPIGMGSIVATAHHYPHQVPSANAPSLPEFGEVNGARWRVRQYFATEILTFDRSTETYVSSHNPAVTEDQLEQLTIQLHGIRRNIEHRKPKIEHRKEEKITTR